MCSFTQAMIWLNEFWKIILNQISLKFYVSMLVTNQKTNVIYSFFHDFFFQSSAEMSNLGHSRLLFQCEIWNLIFCWTRYKTKINQHTGFLKCVIQCVLLCLSYLLMYMFFLGGEEKNWKLKSLLHQTHTEKQNANTYFET